MRQTDSGVWIIETSHDISLFAKLWAFREGISVGIDTETRPLNPTAKVPNARTDTLVGVGLSFYYQEHQSPLTVYGLARGEFIQALRVVLSTLPWYAHNAMFDAMVLRRVGVKLGEHVGDPRIIAYLLGEPEAALKPLLREKLGVETQDFRELLLQYGAADISQVPIEAQADYCAGQDAARCVLLERLMRQELIEQAPKAFEVYTRVELPMVSILTEMSYRGIQFNREKAEPMLGEAERIRFQLDRGIDLLVKNSGFVEFKLNPDGSKYQKVCKACRNGVKKRPACGACAGAGKLAPEPLPFNAGSWQQRERFLYNFLGIAKKRFSGQIKPWQVERGMYDPDEIAGATDQLALLQNKERHVTIPLMLSRGKWSKKEGFLRGWLQGSEGDGRLHTTFTNTAVASGRLSSRDPNLQQIELGLRELLEADPGCEIVAGDMSQLELVIMAYASRDPVMIEILNKGWDMHRITGEAIYGIPWRQIPKDSPMRYNAKTTNYLTGYGGKADKLIEGVEKLALSQPELGLNVPDRAEAKRMLLAHRNKYQGYWRWVDRMKALTRVRGYSETVFGRPRFFPDINSHSDEYRTEAERAAVNHIIQGTAADLMKQVMINIDRDELMSQWGYQVLQVHDEIVSVVRSEFVLDYIQRLTVHMQLDQPFKPIVELSVDAGHGLNWKETHK